MWTQIYEKYKEKKTLSKNNYDEKQQLKCMKRK